MPWMEGRLQLEQIRAIHRTGIVGWLLTVRLAMISATRSQSSHNCCEIPF